MSWQTNLFTNIIFNKATYNSIGEVKDSIKLSKAVIERLKKELLSLALMTEPQKFCPENSDPFIWIPNTVEDVINSLEEEFIELFKLELLEDYWKDCHDKNGLAIPPPNNISKAYLDGDFVKTNKKEENEI